MTSALVLLHGFGSDGNDMFGFAPMLSKVFPEAAIYAPNGVSETPLGMGYQWFSDNDWTFKDRPGMDIAKQALEEYLLHIEKETGVKRHKIVILSFSQGTMTALFSVPRMQQPVGGLVGFSGRMFWDEELKELETYHTPPVVLIHGAEDEVVDPKSTPEAQKRLKQLGFDVKAYEVPGLGHGIDEEAFTHAVHAVKRFLKE